MATGFQAINGANGEPTRIERRTWESCPPSEHCGACFDRAQEDARRRKAQDASTAAWARFMDATHRP